MYRSVGVPLQMFAYFMVRFLFTTLSQQSARLTTVITSYPVKLKLTSFADDKFVETFPTIDIMS